MWFCRGKSGSYSCTCSNVTIQTDQTGDFSNVHNFVKKFVWDPIQSTYWSQSRGASFAPKKTRKYTKKRKSRSKYSAVVLLNPVPVPYLSNLHITGTDNRTAGGSYKRLQKWCARERYTYCLHSTLVPVLLLGGVSLAMYCTRHLHYTLNVSQIQPFVENEESFRKFCHGGSS